MHLKRTSLIILAGATLMLFGCGSVDEKVYQGQKPEISIKKFYSEPVVGYGFFQSRSGEIKDRYYVTLVPTWNGNEGTIIEKQWNQEGKLFFQQQWHLTVSADGKSHTGTATMVDGKIKGQSSGYAMHMEYALKVPKDNGGTVTLSADDWTYLQPDGSGINLVALSKFGFHVGDVTYQLHKLAHGEKLHEGYFPLAQ